MIVRGLFLSFFIFVFSYIAVVLFMYQTQRDIMYTPATSLVKLDDLGVENAQVISVITHDGISLNGWFFPPKSENNKIIVFFHGNGQNIGSSFFGVSKFLDHGYGLLMVEYRGYAGHDGVFTEDGVYRDCRAFINWLHNKMNIEYSNMVFFGESLGTALAVQMASEYRGNSLVLIAPFSSILDMAKVKYPYLPVSYLLKDKYLSDIKIGQVNMPTIIVHGSNDNVVDIRFGRKLFEAAKQPKKFIKINNANHLNLYNFGLIEHIDDFLITND